MKYSVIRSFMHFEYSEIEADSREEAIKLAQYLEDEDWEVDENLKLTKQRQIDIQKACNTYCRFCPHQCENYPHDDCQIQIGLYKAMEE